MDEMVMRLELDRCQLFQALMRTRVIVVPAPGFDVDAHHGAAAEPFERQAFVTKLAVEALCVAVLPGLAGIEKRGVDTLRGQPFEKDMADKLVAVFGAIAVRPVALGGSPDAESCHGPSVAGTCEFSDDRCVDYAARHRMAIEVGLSRSTRAYR
jgi:hypothetical protein